MKPLSVVLSLVFLCSICAAADRVGTNADGSIRTLGVSAGGKTFVGRLEPTGKNSFSNH